MSDEQPERFAPTSGRVMGVVGLLCAGVVAVTGVTDGDSGVADWAVALALLGAVLFWAALLRPRVSLVGDDLELRNMLETVTIPLAAIEELAVRQVLAVRVGNRRHVSPALGRSRRQLQRSPQTLGGEFGRGLGDVPSKPANAPGTIDYTDFVEERIRQRMKEARAARGVRPGSDEQAALASGVRRQPAWPEIAGSVVLLVAVVVLFVV